MQPRQDPLVSVVVPAFNAARTIRASVISALSQTYEHIEVVVCDDGSSDDTLAVLRSIGDPRLRVALHTHNLGPGAARDTAIASAVGEWIALLDADDEWHPTRVSELLQVVNPGEIVFDDLMLCHDGSLLRPIRRVHGDHGFGATRGHPCIVPLPAYIRSERLLIQPLIDAKALRASGIRHSARRFAEDAEFIIHLCLAGMRLHYLPKPLYYYRLTPGSLTADRSARGQMYAMLDGFLSMEGLPPAVRHALEEKCEHLALDEHAYEAVDHLGRGNVLGFLAVLSAHPPALFRILRRLPHRAFYEIHRILARVPARP